MSMGLFGLFPVQEAQPIPSRMDFSVETYRCTECGGEITIGSVESLRPCPGCNNSIWEASKGPTRRKTHPKK
jgi:predicted RNA-binding Zn-ribbon protein involved in translation (DUF1610 family)